MYAENEVITSLPFNYQIKRSPNYSLHNFDLERLIGLMKKDKKWINGEMNMMILLRSPAKIVILVIVHAKTEITSHQKNESTACSVIYGSMKLQFGIESATLNTGDLLTLTEKCGYSIDSMEESAFLMVLKS